MNTNAPTLISVGGRQAFSPAEIIMIKAHINYSFIHLIDGQTIIVATTLKKLEERFATISNFIRPNKSVLVNLAYVAHFSENSFFLVNNLTCEVSRRRKRILKSL